MLIPTVVEADGRAERAFDIYSRLLRDRIVFLGREVDEEIANVIVAQLLLLEADDPDADMSLYVNSPGGSAYAGMAIYDAMQHIRPDVRTICFGMGMSAAAMIVAGGAPGKRFALPNAKLMIHQGSAGYRGAPGRHRHRGARGPVHDPADGGDPRAPHGPRRRAGARGHRPRPVHDTRGGRGIRSRRRRASARVVAVGGSSIARVSARTIHHLGVAVHRPRRGHRDVRPPVRRHGRASRPRPRPGRRGGLDARRDGPPGARHADGRRHAGGPVPGEARAGHAPRRLRGRRRSHGARRAGGCRRPS